MERLCAVPLFVSFISSIHFLNAAALFELLLTRFTFQRFTLQRSTLRNTTERSGTIAFPSERGLKNAFKRYYGIGVRSVPVSSTCPCHSSLKFL